MYSTILYYGHLYVKKKCLRFENIRICNVCIFVFICDFNVNDLLPHTMLFVIIVLALLNCAQSQSRVISIDIINPRNPYR